MTMQEKTKPNYYEVLQLQPYANPALVIAAYRILSKLYHPDTAKEEANLEKFRLIQQAYETLSDPQKRKEYDQELRYTMPNSGGFDYAGFRPDEEVRDPMWETPAQNEYTPSPEDLEFYKNLYDYDLRGRRRRTILMIVIYIILMTAAVGFGLLGFFNVFSSEADSTTNAILCFCVAILLLVIAQVEAYYS